MLQIVVLSGHSAIFLHADAYIPSLAALRMHTSVFCYAPRLCLQPQDEKPVDHAGAGTNPASRGIGVVPAFGAPRIKHHNSNAAGAAAAAGLGGGFGAQLAATAAAAASGGAASKSSHGHQQKLLQKNELLGLIRAAGGLGGSGAAAAGGGGTGTHGHGSRGSRWDRKDREAANVLLGLMAHSGPQVGDGM